MLVISLGLGIMKDKINISCFITPFLGESTIHVFLFHTATRGLMVYAGIVVSIKEEERKTHEGL